jgi:hypothetical protein
MNRHTVEVFEVIFCKIGEDGEPLTNNRGNPQLYMLKDNNKSSSVKELVEDKDLKEINYEDDN